MFFVVVKVVKLHTQTAVQNLGFSSSDTVDCYVYGVLARSMNVSALIIDKGNAKYFETCHSAICSPQAPCGLRCTQNKRLTLTYRISQLLRRY